MSNDTKNVRINLASLWIREMKSTGEQYYTGAVNNGCRLVIMKNSHKKSDKHPDAFAYLYPASNTLEEKKDDDNKLNDLLG